MKRILITVGCRSDEGLSKPIIRRLKEQDWCEIYICKLKPQEFSKSYNITEAMIGDINPDLLFVTGDRVEQCAAAAAAFHNKIKIAHYYAGVVNYPATTFDDTDRHCITLWSDIQFTESNNASEVVWDIKHAVGLKWNCFEVGISHLDDLQIDESLVPYDQVVDQPYKTLPYTLVLYNQPTKINDDIEELFSCSHLYNDYFILIGGNPDRETDKILIDLSEKYYPSLPRPQFLGLLKNCQRFVTNSSAGIYEAPYFLPQERIIMVGDRNRNRPREQFKTGASNRIVKILKDLL